MYELWWYGGSMCSWNRTLMLILMVVFPGSYSFGTPNDWLYLINMQDISIDSIATSGFDLVVMDYSHDGSLEGEFSPLDIRKLHDAGMTVLCYFSIGEAEDYRYYWHATWKSNPPSWLGPVNPEWEGNYKVRYWDSGWKELLFGIATGNSRAYLDRIIDQGFDGVYLDIVDAYEYWSEENVELTRHEARLQMKQLVEEIRNYARTNRGRSDFLIVPQNALHIILNDDDEVDDLGRAYLDLCNGIGAEDTWYNETDLQAPDEIERTVAMLDIFRTEGRERFVLSVDYVWNVSNPISASNIQRYNFFHRQARERGYLSYAAAIDRALDRIVIRSISEGFEYAQPLPNPAGISHWLQHSMIQVK